MALQVGDGGYATWAWVWSEDKGPIIYIRITAISCPLFSQFMMNAHSGARAAFADQLLTRFENERTSS